MAAEASDDNTWRQDLSCLRHALSYAGMRKLEMGSNRNRKKTNSVAALVRSTFGLRMYGMSANDQHWMLRKGHKFVCGMQPLTALVTLISTWKRRNTTVYQTEQCGERRRGKKQKNRARAGVREFTTWLLMCPQTPPIIGSFYLCTSSRLRPICKKMRSLFYETGDLERHHPFFTSLKLTM